MSGQLEIVIEAPENLTEDERFLLVKAVQSQMGEKPETPAQESEGAGVHPNPQMAKMEALWINSLDFPRAIDAALKELGLPVVLEKSVLGSEKPGHKWRLRKPKARGGYNYTYQEPTLKQTETPEFKAWFKGSQATSFGLFKQGSTDPLVMYHGTTADSDFHSFNSTNESSSVFARWVGPHFAADPAMTDAFTIGAEAQSKARRAPDNPDEDVPSGGRVLPVYLSLKHPLPAAGWGWDDDNVLESSLAAIKDTHPGLAATFQRTPEDKRRALWPRLKAALIAEGYDSITYLNTNNNEFKGVHGAPLAVIVFSPEQIKSATANSGAFNPEDPDITKSMEKAIDLGAWGRPLSLKMLQRSADAINRLFSQSWKPLIQRTVELGMELGGALSPKYLPAIKSEVEFAELFLSSWTRKFAADVAHDVAKRTLTAYRMRENPRQFAFDLRREFLSREGGFGRDWRRVSITQCNLLAGTGRLAVMKPGQYVVGYAYPSACSTCKRLMHGHIFLRIDAPAKPTEWQMENCIWPGKSNHGIQRKAWHGCVSVHPLCRCVAYPIYVEDWWLNKEGRLKPRAGNEREWKQWRSAVKLPKEEA